MNKYHFKNKSLVMLTTCVITSFFCVQILQAEPLPPRGPIPYHLYDINSDGAISQDEFNTIRGHRMKSRAAQGGPMGNMASEPIFKQFDTDNDGQLNPDELARGQQVQRQKRWEMRQGQGMGMRQGQGMGMRQAQGMGMRQGRGMGGGRNMPKFEDFDGNSDGYISEQELIEARSMRISSRIQQGYQMKNTANITQFQEIDTSSDGKISPEEFSAQQKQHQMERQRPQ